MFDSAFITSMSLIVDGRTQSVNRVRKWSA